MIILCLKIVLNIKLYHLHTPMELPQQQEHKHTEEDYIKQLTPFEESAYKIAKSHLGTSFNLKKSNGYLKWIGKK